MFTNIFIHFLLSRELIDKKQAQEALSKRDVRVRPSVIAVYEKLMTEEQAKMVAELQVVNDMPFGFLAVREGFLTHEQVASSISGKRAKGDMRVLQVLSDKGIMSMSRAMECLEEFKGHYRLSDSAYEKLADNSVEGFVEYVGGVGGDNLLSKYAIVFLKTYIRCIDSSLRIDAANEADCIKGRYISTIGCSGDRQLVIGAAFEDKRSALNLAGRFVRQKQREYNEDVEDSIKEFINLTAGLFATLLEKDLNLDIDLETPNMIIDGEFKPERALSAMGVYTVDCAMKIFVADTASGL